MGQLMQSFEEIGCLYVHSVVPRLWTFRYVNFNDQPSFRYIELANLGKTFQLSATHSRVIIDFVLVADLLFFRREVILIKMFVLLENISI